MEDIIILESVSNFREVEIPKYLLNEHYQDRYFDVIDALEEARHIFLEGNSLIDRLKNKPTINIGETGFGAGRTFLTMLDYLNKSGLKNLEINYYTVELHPISTSKMENILSNFNDSMGSFVKVLSEMYDSLNIENEGWYRTCILQPFGKVNFNLRVGEAMKMIEELNESCDTWFLDGHGPKKNPAIWREELLKGIASKTKLGGSFATFTVSVAVNKALSENGFITEKFTGRGKKKHFLKGTKA